MKFTVATSILSAFSFAVGAPLEQRAVIDHDAVVGFPQTVPSGIEGTLYLKYKPYLYVQNGCVPFPAVDAEGNTRYVLTMRLPQAVFVASERQSLVETLKC